MGNIKIIPDLHKWLNRVRDQQNYKVRPVLRHPRLQTNTPNLWWKIQIQSQVRTEREGIGNFQIFLKISPSQQCVIGNYVMMVPSIFSERLKILRVLHQPQVSKSLILNCSYCTVFFSKTAGRCTVTVLCGGDPVFHTLFQVHHSVRKSRHRALHWDRFISFTQETTDFISAIICSIAVQSVGASFEVASPWLALFGNKLVEQFSFSSGVGKIQDDRCCVSWVELH